MASGKSTTTASGAMRVADDKHDKTDEAPKAAPADDFEARVQAEAARRVALLTAGREVIQDAAHDRGGRPTRAQEMRAAEPVREEAEDDDIAPSLLLDTRHIPARPGFVQRWIRTTADGVDDPGNVARKLNQGWKPRPADSVPEGSHVPTIADRRFGNVIGVEGNILMEMPEELHQRRARANRRLIDDQQRAIDTNIYREFTPGQGFGPPQIDRTGGVSRGRAAMRVADD